MSNYIIYTDGGSRGNPGVAGAGALVQDENGRVLKEVSESLGIETNNYAEYAAVALGLNTLRKVVKKDDRKSALVEVRLDSELVQKQLSNEWKLEEESLFPLFMQVRNLVIEHFPNTSFVHVRREQNKEADRLANQAMDEATTTQGELI